mgnify:CR=1 FL=1
MQRLRFLHIPKTAGTTLRDALFRLYPEPRFIFHGNIANDLRRYRALSLEQRGSIQLYFGHSPFRLPIDDLLGVDTITFIREPVSRVVSWFHHLLENKSPEMAGFFPQQQFDLEFLLASGHEALNNLQARYLLGDADYGYCQNMDDQRIVDAAVERLAEEMRAFGLAERFDDSLLLFKRTLRWPLPLYRYRNVRNSSMRLNLDAPQLRKVRELNRIDIEIYHRAKRIFSERVRRNTFYLLPTRLLFRAALSRDIRKRPRVLSR